MIDARLFDRTDEFLHVLIIDYADGGQGVAPSFDPKQDGQIRQQVKALYAEEPDIVRISHCTRED